MDNVGTFELGTSKELTYADELLLRRMYGCGKSFSHSHFRSTFVSCIYFKLAEDPTTTTSTTPPACIKPNWKGDGFCDDMNNVASCDYDGGDCCGNNVDTTYCDDCECLDPQMATCFDKSNTCAYWATLGYCTHTYVNYMQSDCKKSCGLC